MEVFLERFSAKQEDFKAIPNNSKAAYQDLERQKLPEDHVKMEGTRVIKLRLSSLSTQSKSFCISL